MIKSKRMKLVKSENDINYYLFTPSVFSLYYNDKTHSKADEPPHRYSLTHKLHMLNYILRGGYKILYLEQDGKILSYIVFTKANKQIIKGCEADDYYTIFLWTYSENRGKGLATKMAEAMLKDLKINFNHFYKTISKDNYSSIRVAEKCGFSVKCDSIKRGLFHTINQVENGDQYLYWLKNGKY